MSRHPSRGLTPRRRRAGYTMIEVMMALAVLTAGAVGIMALQRAATRGNMIAREMGVATQLSQLWVGRLRRDALNWTLPSQVANPIALNGTSYLQNVPAPGDPAAWFIPTPEPASGESSSFDYYGRDIVGGAPAADEPPVHYCANVRLEWIYPGRAMRADVRIWFARRGRGNNNVDSDQANLANCAGGNDPNALTNDFRVRAVYTSTVIRYQPVPRT